MEELSNYASLVRDKKDDKMEIKTNRSRLMIALFIIFWIANLSNHTSLEKKNRKMTEVLSDCAFLTSDEKDNKMEVKTDGSKLTIALFVIVWIVFLSNHASLEEKNKKVTEVLSNRISLAKDKTGDRIEIKTYKGRLTITLSIFI